MGFRAGSKALKLQKRATLSAKVKSNAGKSNDTKKRQQEKLSSAPVIVQHAVVRPETIQPLPRFTASHPLPPPSPGIYVSYAARRARPVPQIRAVQQPKIINVPSNGPSQQHFAPPVRAIEQHKREKPLRVRRPARRVNFDWEGFGNIDDLRTLLGLGKPTLSPFSVLGLGRQSSPAQPYDAVLVSIDTESERHGLIDNVVEIGICILRIPNIYDLEPGEHVWEWVAEMEHRHIVIDITRKPTIRMHSSLFGSKSLFLSPADARAMVVSTLQAAAAHKPLPKWPPSESEADSKEMGTSVNPVEQTDTPESASLILVGQSIAGDVATLKGRPLDLTLAYPGKGGSGDKGASPTVPSFKAVFDTLSLTIHARLLGFKSPSARLGQVARALGVNPVYWAGQTVNGTHNAINDAAYTMMVLLLYAVRWDDLTNPKPGSTAAGSPLASDGNSRRDKRPDEVLARRLDVKRARESTQSWRRATWDPLIIALGVVTGMVGCMAVVKRSSNADRGEEEEEEEPKQK